jgi:hypothetical protein
MVMSAIKEFERLLNIAYTSATVYTKTNASSCEEAILKLNIMGDFELANKFEKDIKQLYEENRKKDN